LTRSKNKSLSQLLKEEELYIKAIELYKKGWNCTKIAEFLNISPYNVRNWIYYGIIPYGKHIQRLMEKLGAHSIIELKNELENLYWKEGISIEDISKRIGVSYGSLYRIMKTLEIKIRNHAEGNSYKQRKLREKVYLDNTIKEVLDGVMLSDGYIDPRGRLILPQVESHIDWLKWIKSILNRRNIECKIEKRKQSLSKLKTYQLRTLNYPFLIDERKRWYYNGRKIVPNDLKLTPLLLAQWFQGDGCNSGEKYFRLSTNSFTLDEVYFLKELLKSDLNIDSNIYKQRKGQYVIVVTKRESMRRFLTIIEPFILPSFQYKLDFKKKGWIWL